jgi:hypothetical protein
MKHVLVILFCANALYAQNTGVYEPEFVGDIVWQKDQTKCIPLEKQRATVKNNISTSTYIIGIGSAKANSFVKGGTSPVGIPRQEQLTFIVNTGSND